MLSHDLRDLYTTFAGWLRGDGEAFTIEAAKGFERKLKHGAAKAALLELGVDPHVFDTDVPIEDVLPSAQLIAFPAQRIVRREPNGSAR